MLRYTLRQLEYFVAVGEAGSIARASERINVSSPSISAAIAQLEQEFGLPLFVRQHAQGLSLTQGGRQMMEQARLVLREASALTDIAGDIAGKVRGPLSVGCLLTFAQLVLPGLRRGFETTYPDVRLRQFELNQVELFSALRRSEIDIALTYDIDVPADLQFTGLLRLPPMALMGSGHPLADRDGVTVEELKDHPMVLLDLPLSADYFLSFFDGTGGKPVIAERTRDMAVMRSMVANDFGYSIANVRPLSDTSPDGNPVRCVPITGNVRPLRMGFLTAQDADRSNAVRAFIEYGIDLVRAGKLARIGGVPVV
ncbi:LysR family transcriptional regulator [Mameliella alba]|nr:LysR family transcriptional regulator [Antarctobacter heliothermus]MBY6144560.1 LysR family transcriptional regulator [Mameliella alba]MBY6160087.1 LysR family transcriptional regulator [Mameliella alba]MBY6168557.1 LysR family transcriptional regulator [Mameliella alba]MBY6174222.1 LysR family transcriptional regulator [Mameliella alba]